MQELILLVLKATETETDMTASKIETYECPAMIAANFNRPGGLMEIHYFEQSVRVVQTMPNPESENLPWITIADVEMSLSDLPFVTDSFPRLNVKLVKTVSPQPQN